MKEITPEGEELVKIGKLNLVKNTSSLLKKLFSRKFVSLEGDTKNEIDLLNLSLFDSKYQWSPLLLPVKSSVLVSFL